MFIVRSNEVSGEEPGLLSVASAIPTRCLRISSSRRRLSFAEKIEGTRKHDRDGACARHRRNAVFVGIFEVVS